MLACSGSADSHGNPKNLLIRPISGLNESRGGEVDRTGTGDAGIVAGATPVFPLSPAPLSAIIRP